MKKIFNRIMAAALTSVMIVSLMACGESKDKEVVAEAKYGQVWSAPSTVKIELNEKDYANKGEAVLSYEAVKNEYESCQLILSAEKAVERFELKTSDLKNGSSVLDAKNIEVYVQKYITYTYQSTSGNMPDALLPMSVADEYGENKIAAGDNGALWVTVYIPKETEAGLYKGTFELIMEGKNGKERMDIPVSVNVYDYTLTDALNARSIFSWRYDQTAAGELDGSIDMMTYYYDFYQDYRISMQSLPLETLSGQEFVDAVVKYYDQLSSYCLLSNIGNITGNLLYEEEAVEEQILAVAAVSTADRNYFEKAMIYFQDEPDFNNAGVRANVVKNIHTLNRILQEAVDAIKADTSDTYANFKQIENWEDSILGIPSIIPEYTEEWIFENENTPEGQEFLNAVSCLCPQFAKTTDETVAKLKALCDKYDIELWWYGCDSPEAPYPTYHIGDKNLLSARTVTWVQSKHEIEGNLYWDTAGYTDASTNTFIDVYEWPYRSEIHDWEAGDGNLSYPGAAYGVYGPLPSIRLMSIRDGMEEYELLEDVKAELRSKNNVFGTEITNEEIMNLFYDAVYEDIYHMYADGEDKFNFTELRKELLELTVGVKAGLGFVMTDVKVLGETGTFSYYIQEGATVSINGQEQQPVSPLTYKYEMNLSEATDIEVTVTNADGKSATYHRYVAEPMHQLNSLSEQSVMDGITETNGSKAEFVSTDKYATDGTSVHFNVNGVLTGDELEDAVFVPSVSLATSLFGGTKLSELSLVEMDVYNPGATFSFRLKVYSGASYVDVGSYDVNTGKNTITVKLTDDQRDSIANADKVVMEFVNAKDNKALSYEFYLDNLIGEK